MCTVGVVKSQLKCTGQRKDSYIVGATDHSAHRAADSFPCTTHKASHILTVKCMHRPLVGLRTITLCMGEHLSAVDGVQDADCKPSKSHRKLGDLVDFSNIRKSLHIPNKRRADGLEHTIDSLKRDLTAASSKVCSTALVCISLPVEAPGLYSRLKHWTCPGLTILCNVEKPNNYFTA